MCDKLIPGQKVTKRQCKDRTATLVKAFKADEMSSLRASETTEEYGEREQLLTEVLELINEVTEADFKKKML